jgi:hypothetical protein
MYVYGGFVCDRFQVQNLQLYVHSWRHNFWSSFLYGSKALKLIFPYWWKQIILWKILNTFFDALNLLWRRAFKLNIQRNAKVTLFLQIMCIRALDYVNFHCIIFVSQKTQKPWNDTKLDAGYYVGISMSGCTDWANFRRLNGATYVYLFR